MKLQIKYTDEETGLVVIFKVKKLKIHYHNSEIHDPKEFECIKDRIMNFGPKERLIVDTLYSLVYNLAASID